MSSFYGNGGGKAGGSSDSKPVIIEYGRVVTTEEGTFIELKIQDVLEPLKINVGSLIDIYNGEPNAKQIQVTVDNSLNTIAAAIVAGSVGTTELTGNAVTTAKIADANVTTAKLANSAVTAAKIADKTITNGKIADGTIAKAKLATTVQNSLTKADNSASTTALSGEITRAKAAEAQALTDAKAYTDSALTWGTF